MRGAKEHDMTDQVTVTIENFHDRELRSGRERPGDVRSDVAGSDLPIGEHGIVVRGVPVDGSWTFPPVEPVT